MRRSTIGRRFATMEEKFADLARHALNYPFRVAGEMKKDKWLIWCLLLVTLFSGLFCYYSLIKYLSLSDTGWDLGLYSQTLYTTLHGDGLFYTNLNGASYLQEHFSLFLYFLIPLYMAFPSPVTLLILQAILLSFAGVPLFLLSRRLMLSRESLDILDSKHASIFSILIVVSYELSPLTESPLTFDFHLMALLPFFYIGSMYFLVNRKWMRFASFLVLIAFIHSSFAIIDVFVLIFAIFYYRKAIFSIRLRGNMAIRVRQWRVLAGVAVGSILLIAYYIFAAIIKSIMSGHGIVVNPATESAGSYSSGLSSLLFLAITKPSIFLSYIEINASSKFGFLLIAFGTSAFLSLLSPFALLPSIAYFGYAMPSSFYSYYQLGYQYPSLLIPVIFSSVPFGISYALRTGRVHAINDISRLKTKFGAILIVMMLIGTAFGFFLDPIAPNSIMVKEGNYSGMGGYDQSVAIEMFNRVIPTIPAGATILTQNNLFPYFANFKNSYSTPLPSTFLAKNSTDFQFLVAQPGDAWFFISSFSGATSENSSMEAVLNYVTLNYHYGIYAEAGGVYIFERNYSQKPVYVSNYVEFFGANDFFTTHASSFESGTIVTTNVTPGQVIWFGPYTTLLPGTYSITFLLKSNRYANGSFVKLDISAQSGNTLLSNYILLANNYTIPNKMISVTINLTIKKLYTAVEFRGFDASWQGTLRFYGVAVQSG